MASPISATGVLVPVIYGLARGESPSFLQLAGVVVAICGVLLAVRPSSGSSGRAMRDGLSVLFATGAALGFGALFVGVSVAAKHNPAWAVCVVRAGACGVIITGALIVRRPLPARELDLPWLAAIGVLEVLGASLYASATTIGQVSLVAVAASLYPAVAVVLAAYVMQERLGSIRRAGVVLTLLGISAIAVGG